MHAQIVTVIIKETHVPGYWEVSCPPLSGSAIGFLKLYLLSREKGYNEDRIYIRVIHILELKKAVTV